LIFNLNFSSSPSLNCRQVEMLCQLLVECVEGDAKLAWLIYAHRLSLGDCPFARLHPRVAVWMEKLGARPEFEEDHNVAESDGAARSYAAFAGGGGKTLEAVAGF
jgi:hypothetical protein